MCRSGPKCFLIMKASVDANVDSILNGKDNLFERPDKPVVDVRRRRRAATRR